MSPAVASLCLLAVAGAGRRPLEPIPDKLVVLTFDDASKSHYTVARPLLQEVQVRGHVLRHRGVRLRHQQEGLHDLGRDRPAPQGRLRDRQPHPRPHGRDRQDASATCRPRSRAINARCKEHGIPQPVSFAYPGNAIAKDALPVLKDLGIKFARRGGSPEYPYKEGRGFAYEPGLDHPLLIPSAGDARPTWTLDDFKAAVAQARHGKIAVLQFHGVPDTAHDWVNTPKEQFEAYMKYLADEKFTVIAMRDLAKYVDPDVAPSDPFGVIEDRKKLIEARRDGSNARPAKDDAELAVLAGRT